MATIWRKMAKKGYRDGYVSAHVSNTVAAQITALREARNWTQSQLAEKAGMKQPRVSALEDPNYENFEAKTLRRIASAFDVGLSIRFVPFSDIVWWANSVSDDRLLVPSFLEDSLSPRGTASARAMTYSFAREHIVSFGSVGSGHDLVRTYIRRSQDTESTDDAVLEYYSSDTASSALANSTIRVKSIERCLN